MGDEPGGSKTSNPCCEGLATLAKVEEVIRDTDQFEDTDARTCFWLYTESLNGDQNKKVEFSRVLDCMKEHRPAAHQLILQHAGHITAL